MRYLIGITTVCISVLVGGMAVWLYEGGLPHADEIQSVPQQADSCAAHNVPKALCFICDPNLRQKGRSWCVEHNCYEDRCWECHPEAEDKDRLYCKEHSLYEDECLLCHPELLKRAAESGDTKPNNGQVLMCEEHGVPEEECELCRSGHAEEEMAVLSEEQIRANNIQVAEAGPGEIAVQLALPGEVRLNSDRVVHVVPRVAGVVREALATVGDDVKAGQVMAVLESRELATIKAEYLSSKERHALAKAMFDREKDLWEKKISA